VISEQKAYVQKLLFGNLVTQPLTILVYHSAYYSNNLQVDKNGQDARNNVEYSIMSCVKGVG
jgi:hypothetical protein